MDKKFSWIPLTDRICFQKEAELRLLKKGEWVLNKSYFYLIDEGVIAWSHAKIKPEFNIFLSEGMYFNVQGPCQAKEETVIWQVPNHLECHAHEGVKELTDYSQSRIKYWSKFLRANNPIYFILQWLIRHTQVKKVFQKTMTIDKEALKSAYMTLNISFKPLNDMFNNLKENQVIADFSDESIVIDVLQLYFYTDNIVKNKAERIASNIFSS